jgi:hypothetical protein
MTDRRRRGPEDDQHSPFSNIDGSGRSAERPRGDGDDVDLTWLQRRSSPAAGSRWPGATRCAHRRHGDRPKRRAQREWKGAQLALNEQLGTARVAACALLEIIPAVNVEEDLPM